MTPDWSQAPEGARYFNMNTGLWYRRKFYEAQSSALLQKLAEQ